MRRQFEYRVCQVQNTRVTFVNGCLAEASTSDPPQKEQILETRPPVWDFLQHAGAEGWELVAALDAGHDEGSLEVGMGGVGYYQILYLKRQKVVAEDS